MRNSDLYMSIYVAVCVGSELTFVKFCYFNCLYMLPLCIGSELTFEFFDNCEVSCEHSFFEIIVKSQLYGCFTQSIW